MKNIIIASNDRFTWQVEKKKVILFSEKEIIVEINTEKTNKATFSLKGKNYIIKSEGFWNPKTIIENDGQQLVVFSHPFFGGLKGKIDFSNGNKYLSRVRNSPLVKLIFLTTGNVELINYKLESSLNPNSLKTIMSVFPSDIPKEEFLLLMILGCYSFLNIVKENTNNDFITMVATA